MKKLALAAAVAAATMASTGVHAVIANGVDLVFLGSPDANLAIDCSATFDGAMTTMVVENDGIAGTVCLDAGAIHLMFNFSMTNPPGGVFGSTMNGGAISVASGSGLNWTPYSVIDISISNVSCPGLTPPILLPGAWPGNRTGNPACTLNLLGLAAEIYLY
jgi:hypothetical protein